MKQATWDDFHTQNEITDEPSATIEDSPPDDESTPIVRRQLAPDDPRSCPWCLAPPSEQSRNENSRLLGCGVCGAVIPEGAKWYQEGRKMVNIPEAANLHYAAKTVK